MKKTILILALLSTACATQQQQPCAMTRPSLNATLWMQTSAEYHAITREVYATALRTLDEAVADKTWTAATEQKSVDPSMPPAIILDLDETILDTSGHQVKLIRSGEGYTEAGWHDWAMHDSSHAIEAAHDFLLEVQKRGVAIYYVTNRLKNEEEPLRASLTRLGFPLTADNLLTKGGRPEWESSDKSPRRAFVASKNRVVMLFGDDLNDFAAAKGKTLEQRDAIVRDHAADWGRKWFALPNPVYGSWEQTIVGNTAGCEQIKRKMDSLRE